MKALFRLVSEWPSLGFSSSKQWVSCYLLFPILGCKPVLYELLRWPIVQCRVPPLPVVKHFSVFKRHRLHGYALRKTLTIDPLVLETAEPVLSRCVIPADILAAHGTSCRRPWAWPGCRSPASTVPRAACWTEIQGSAFPWPWVGCHRHPWTPPSIPASGSSSLSSPLWFYVTFGRLFLGSNRISMKNNRLCNSNSATENE